MVRRKRAAIWVTAGAVVSTTWPQSCSERSNIGLLTLEIEMMM